jgi:ABC-type glycerol-3-phosphate transport system substrate-binding protein
MRTITRRRLCAIVSAAIVSTTAIACGGNDTAKSGTGGEPEGDILVLTQRTDVVNTLFQDYKKQFEAKYPKVHVKFQAITDYEGEVRTRMNTSDYGDVLLIPNSVTANQLPQFFEPLGTVADMKKKYRFINEQAYDGKVYGLAITGNAIGFVYNKKVWKQAGVASAPKTPQEFLSDLQAIKTKTKAVPLYTNYKDGWPLTQWEAFRGAMSDDPDVANELTTDTAPWAAGKEHNVIDSLLYDVVHQKLVEDDPSTTNWENSKKLLGTGQIATMALGSWAIVQMQEAAGANKDDIGYLPFPMQKDGRFYTPISGDYKNAINIHSKHKAAARAWVDWFADESGYSVHEGGISPKLGGPPPTTLKDFTDLGVQQFELTPAPAGKEGLLGKLQNDSEIQLFDPKYRQEIVDAARGAKNESLQQIFDSLDKKWAQAVKDDS